jgi:hypothetical protein
MGADFGDCDNDGDLDLLVPDMSYNNLYLNEGRGMFQDVTAVSGLAALSGQFVTWSGDFADFDNDGDLDLLLSNGDAHRLDTMEMLFLTNLSTPGEGLVLRDLTADSGPWFREKSVARGLATADWDNDGDLDFFLLNIDRPSELLRNDGGDCGHWLMVDLVGTRSNRDAIGARVTVRAGDLMRLDEKRSATGYLSQNDPRLHFGLGARETVDAVEVLWPSGTRQTLSNVAVDRVLRLVEPETEAETP